MNKYTALIVLFLSGSLPAQESRSPYFDFAKTAEITNIFAAAAIGMQEKLNTEQLNKAKPLLLEAYAHFSQYVDDAAKDKNSGCQSTLTEINEGLLQNFKNALTRDELITDLAAGVENNFVELNTAMGLVNEDCSAAF